MIRTWDMSTTFRTFILLLVLTLIVVFSCKKSTEDTPKAVEYQFKRSTYIGYSKAHFEDVENGITTTFDTLYVDSVLVQTDTPNNKIIFTCNSSNPLGVYPQFDYDFDLNSSIYRKDFIKNHYQSFYFEGDSLKSYFFKLQEGNNVSYSKEIKFSGTLQN